MDIAWFSTGLLTHQYGQQRYERALFKAWHARLSPASKVTVFLLTDRAAGDLAAEFPGVEFCCCGGAGRLLNKVRFVGAALNYFLRSRPQVMVCGHMHIAGVCLALKRLFAVPYVLVGYGIDVWEKRSWLRRSALRGALCAISMSAYTASFMERLAAGRAQRLKVFTIPGFVDEKRFVPGPKPQELLARFGLENASVILTVARVSKGEHKGYYSVIQALPAIAAIVPSVRYLIVGGGDDLEGIRSLARQHGVADKVVVTGFVPHEGLPSYYNLCDVFVMPSVQEGFGLVFIEALACGKIVIAGNADGSREALSGGTSGILVDPADQQGLVRTVVAVLVGQLRPSLDTAGSLHQHAAANFGMGAFRERVALASEYVLAHIQEKRS